MTSEENKCACGPWFFPKKLKCWLSRKFDQACQDHDYQYGKRMFSRSQADYRFLEKMLDASETRGDRYKAVVMFGFTRLFGWISWFRNIWRDYQ